jgi:hypothetical protein
MIGIRSLDLLLGITMSAEQLCRKSLLCKIPLVISSLNQLDSFPVSPLVSLVDPHNPPLGSEGFSEVVKLEIFVARVGISDIVIPFRFTVSSINFPSTVVTQFIHKTVLHGRKHHIVDSVPMPRYIIFLLDVRIDSSTDSHHPQKLIDIVAGIPTDSSIDNQHIVDIQPITYLERLILRRTHSQPHSRNVRIVPSIVIHQCRSV